MTDIVIPAHELLNYSPYELKEVLTGEFSLEFSDGILATNDRETILTVPMWQWIKERPVDLKMKYHYSHHMQKRMFHRNMHMDILNCIHWDMYEKYKETELLGDYPLLEKLVEELYVYSNQQYNIVMRWLGKYNTSSSIRDIVGLFDLEEVKEVLANLTPDEQSVMETTRKITEIFSKSMSPDVLANRSIRLARSGVIKMAQLVQCVAPTGYIEDLGGDILEYPLMSNYTDGHRKLYDNMAESRKASQAIDATKEELEDAVYQSRRHEILNQIVATIHEGDCGTTQFIPFRIRKDNGLTASDLRLLSGKYYYLPDDESKTLMEIKPTDEHLIGRVIHMRSYMGKCAHPDPNGICEVCMGAMSLTVPKKTNLGQLMTTDFYAFMIQLQLSKKHHMSNSVFQRLSIGGEDAKYLRAGQDGISYYFAEQMKDNAFKIIIPHEDGRAMTDVMYLTDLEKISASRITQVGSITIEVDYGMYSDRHPYVMGSAKRKASFTHEFLKYVKEVYWEIDPKTDNYIVDMSKWDVSKPFAAIPMRGDSLTDFSAEFKQHIESDAKMEVFRDIMIDPTDFLMDTFDMVNKNMSANMAQVELICLASSIRSAQDGDYSLPKPWSKHGIGILHRSMPMRSAGANQAYEKHMAFYNSVDSFIVTNRMDHPMDVCLLPGDILPKV